MKTRAANDGEREVVLLEAGDRDVSAEEIRRQCEARVTKLVAEACRWSRTGHGRDWAPGDHRMLIFETTVGVGAELYVQFLSEPLEPVAWEVSSGHLDPRAQGFVGAETREKLRVLGFETGGAANNFCKQATIANVGDVRAVAVETLRIFCDALGYRGRTPLVARIIKGTRAERGVVHRSLTPEDVQKIFWHRGCRAERIEGFGTPALHIEPRGTAYDAVLYSRIERQNLYECVDLRLPLGTATAPSLAAVNAINVSYREVKAFADEEGHAWLVQSIGTRGGITEDAFAVHCDLFESVVADPHIARVIRRLARDGAARAKGAGAKGTRKGTEAIH